MAPTRRRLLATPAIAITATGCIRDPGRSCPGATVRLSLSPVDAINDPVRLDSDGLSVAANGVIETAIEGRHVEHCVSWNPSDDETGPSDGLREVGQRVAAHLDIDLEGRRADVEVDAERDGTGYRLEIEFENQA